MSAPGIIMAKRLYRSTTDRWVAGICGGIGEYLEIDPNVIRAIWVIVTVLTGFLPGIIIYILLWLILPEQGRARPVGATAEV
ncbi:MAG: hypothetical protein PWR25_1566 [Euryarchaeota archaeon]|nr:hypothetical protein [Euryarchaeota archaeon]